MSRASLGSSRSKGDAALSETLVSSGGIHADYTPGAIKKIELTDFMIHAHTILYPSSRFNFIIGANGSGKSSIVCAVRTAVKCRRLAN
jgi:structural maintenance of chromosomes protein 5